MPVAPLPKALEQRALAAAAEGSLHRRHVDAIAHQLSMRFLGDPILERVAEPIEFTGHPVIGPTVDYVRALAEGMRRVASERRHAVAIAAPQVGAPVRVILTPVKGLRTIMVNPVVVAKGRKWASDLEGCLSIPEFWMQVERLNWVEVRFTPEDLSETVQVRLEGFEARAVQHELDHLDGKCIIHQSHVTRQQRRHAERCAAKARGKE